MIRGIRTGYEIREGSRILAARRKLAETTPTQRAIHRVAADRIVERGHADFRLPRAA